MKKLADFGCLDMQVDFEVVSLVLHTDARSSLRSILALDATYVIALFSATR